MIKKYIPLLILLFFAQSCSTHHTSQKVYDTLYAPQYAKHFVVLGHGDSVVLRVKNPWQGAQNTQFDYEFSDGKTPQRIIAMSTSHSAFTEALGKGGAVVGVSSPQYYSNEKFAELPDVGFDNNLNYETIVGLNSDLFTTYEIAGENSASTQKLRSLGVNVVYVADYLENSALAKAEWVIAFGAMYGRIGVAKEIFNEVQSNYTRVKGTVDSALSQGKLKRPTVMLNSPYQDVWYLPGDSSYMIGLINDAGGRYIAAGNKDNLSQAVSIEKAYSLLTQADVWLNPAANVKTRDDVRNLGALFEELTIEIYNNTAREGRRGGSDFWESGVLRCDIVLMDIATILYPELFTDHTLYYYQGVE